MSEGEIEAKVVKRNPLYKMTEIGLIAVRKFADPDNRFEIADIGSGDSVALTVTARLDGEPMGLILKLEIPAVMLEEA